MNFRRPLTPPGASPWSNLQCSELSPAGTCLLCAEQEERNSMKRHDQAIKLGGPSLRKAFIADPTFSSWKNDPEFKKADGNAVIGSELISSLNPQLADRIQRHSCHHRHCRCAPRRAKTYAPSTRRRIRRQLTTVGMRPGIGRHRRGGVGAFFRDCPCAKAHLVQWRIVRRGWRSLPRRSDRVLAFDSLSVGSIMRVPGTGQLIVGAWNP